MDEPDDDALATHRRSLSRWPDPIMNFLIAYDIADPKRLNAVAKELERVGRRVQKSLFIYTGSRRDLDGVIVAVVQHIEPSVDRVQAWPIRTSTRACRVDGGAAMPDRGVALIVTASDWTIIEAIDDAGESDHEPFLLD